MKNYVNMDGEHAQMAFYLAQTIFAGSPVCRAKHFHGAGWTWNHSTDMPQCGEEHHPAAAGSQQGVVSYKTQLHWTAHSCGWAVPLKPRSPYAPSTGCVTAGQHKKNLPSQGSSVDAVNKRRWKALQHSRIAQLLFHEWSEVEMAGGEGAHSRELESSWAQTLL